MQGSNDNHKAFKPHSDVDENRHHKRNCNASSSKLKPEDLWRNNITPHHDKVGPHVRTKGSIVECKLFVEIARIPCRK